jgi:methionine-R-sulfoxide reductase
VHETERVNSRELGKLMKEILMKFGVMVLLFIVAFLLHPGPGWAAADSTGLSRPSDGELRKTLSPLQYRVVRENGAEPAFRNEYWDNDKDGIYVDIVSGEPLFSSLDKFRAGTGRPSFAKPLEPDNIIENRVRGWFFIRFFSKGKEVRSRQGDSHLGYVYDDGPAPTGLRYSLNSAALRFIPKEDLEKDGYGMYSRLFSCERNKKFCSGPASGRNG